MSSLFAFYLSTLLLLAPLLVCVGVGTVWGKRALPYSGDFVSRLVTSVCVPALVFRTLVLTELDNRLLLEIGVVTVLALGLSVAACWLILRALRMPVRELVMTAAFPNAGNLGLPMAALAFGETGFSAAIVFFAVCAFVHNTFGVRLLPGANTGAVWRSPVLLASLLAVICRAGELTVPAWMLESMELLGRLTVPLMLFSLGYALSAIPASGMRAGGAIAVMRLVVGGASGWAAAWLLGLDAQMRSLMLMQMAMPCAVISYMFAARYSSRAEISAGAVLLSTALFLVASPLIMALVGAPIAAAR
ncbi:AEC family transporter [Verticiella sediminum]|uniref:AEC family transporter n=1 Tax=Verticiella sediminum TaxID=1247510 RepID=A0A556B012_9BURK|nr:AEC family transporter [Verticiella sediminum]TSH98510.1 AEC family transporter [Verticiella sediminum]